MDDRPVTLDVSILGREYRVACKESEREDLLQAVQFLDRRMREIRDAGKIAGSERIAVMAALNLAHEVLRSRGGAPVVATSREKDARIDGPAARRKIASMRSAIDQALSGQEKLL